MKQHNAIATSILFLASAALSFAGSSKQTIESKATIMTKADTGSTLSERLGYGAQFGVQGAGLHLRYDAAEQFYIRLDTNYLQYDDSFEVDDIDYTGELDFSNVGLLANWLPFSNIGLRITGGAFVGPLQLDGSAGGVGNTIDINGTNYLLGANDQLNTSIEYNTVNPYLGIGWDFAFGAEKNWVLGIDLGVLYMGEPDVSLVGTGALAAATADINAELDSIREDLEDYNFLPVVKIGLTYRF